MSPALDATVRLPRAPKGDGEIFKDVEEETNVGGKAVNVARWLALRGAKVSCGGLLGEDNARPFEKELAKYGIEDVFVRVPGETRRNEMLTWPGGSVKLNRAAFPELENGMTQFSNSNSELQLFNEIGAGDVVIFSGSLPPAVPKDFYAKAVAHFKSLGCTVVVDASGDAMKLALEAKPDLIKPNAEECEALVGFIPRTPDEFRRATDALRRKAGSVIVSDGARGAWFDGEFVPAPPVEVADTTAAGDTLLAEYCWRTWGAAPAASGAGSPSPSRWAVAAGSAACTMPGGSPPPPALVERLAALPNGSREA